MNLQNENKNYAYLNGKATVNHLNNWNPEKHGATFLKPIINGLIIKLKITAK